MNKLNLRANWHQASGKLKQEFANLTNNDSLYKKGKREELLGELEKKFAKVRTSVSQEVENI